MFKGDYIYRLWCTSELALPSIWSIIIDQGHKFSMTLDLQQTMPHLTMKTNMCSIRSEAQLFSLQSGNRQTKNINYVTYPRGTNCVLEVILSLGAIRGTGAATNVSLYDLDKQIVFILNNVTYCYSWFVQKIPHKLSNGKIIHYYVNYSIVGNSRKIPSTPLEGNVFKYTVGLSKGHCYRITIDATTSVGFNQSLQHDPLTVCTGTKQKGLYYF